MEGIDQLLGNRVCVADVSEVESNHQCDEYALEEVQLFHPRLGFMHLDNHSSKVMKLAGNFKDKLL